MDTGPHDPFAVDEEAALAELELAWSDEGYHAFSAGDGHWCAVSNAGRGAQRRHPGRPGPGHPGALAAMQ